MEAFSSYEARVDSIEGWYWWREFNPVLETLNSYQQSVIAERPMGNIGEIGIHHGKSFLALASLAQAGEELLAVDCFGHQEFNIDHSGLGNRAMFESHAKSVLTVGQLSSLNILEMDSNKLTDKDMELANGLKFRFFSVDGSHTTEATYRDLNLVSKHLHHHGFIIVDDYWHQKDSWIGVKHGTDKFLKEHTELTPVYLSRVLDGNNKMVLANADIADDVFKLLDGKLGNELPNLFPSWEQLERPT